MKGLSIVQLGLALLTVVSHPICHASERASLRLNVTLEGSILSWTLQGNLTTDHLIQYTVTVYSSSPHPPQLITETTTDNTFDLDTLELQEGTYYIRVDANLGPENILSSETVIYNASSTGKTSQTLPLTTLLLTISLVLAVVLLVGSVLFAFTMWRVRERARKRQAQYNMRHSRDSTTTKKSRRGCCCCGLCACTRKVGGSSTTRLGREGLQLHTIEARDKNGGGMIPLQYVNRNKMGRPHSEPNGETKPVATPSRGITEDLPYGYVSPADINIPQYRSVRRHTVGEEKPTRSLKQQTPATRPDQYVNIDVVGGASQRVLLRDRSTKKHPSLTESIYSIPCSLEGSTDEVYDNAQHYLEVLPP